MTLRPTLLLLATLAVTHCVTARSQEGDTDGPETQSTATPAPSDAETPKKTMPGWSKPRALQSFKLELTYSERFLVPRGSAIDLTVHDATGKSVYTLKTTTKHDAPPYKIQVTLRAPPTYPLKIDADLLSRVGHRLFETAEISREAVESGRPFTIHLKKL